MRLNKKCSLCKETKSLSEYWNNKKAKDGLYAHCKSCHLLLSMKTREKHRDKYREKARLISANWRKKHPELHKERNKKYRELNKNRYAETRKQKRIDNRKIVISQYGGKCACCGESEPIFLALDHINNDGNLHRKTSRLNDMTSWACRNNFPKNLQLLCHNCNMGKHLNGGVCPHHNYKNKDK